MANRKFSQFTAGGASQVPTDVLVGLDLSQASALQNTKWTLNNLFAKPTLNITDGAMRFGAPGSAPAVSAAAEGSIYFDGTQFQVSSNAGAYTPLGDVSGSFTSGQVVYANGTKSLTGSSGFTFAANALTLGTAGTPGGLRLVGTSGNYWNLASNAPAGNRTLYFPDSTTPTTGNFLFVGTFGATVVTDWSTGLTWSNTTKQLTVTAALDDVIGLGVQNTSAGTAAQCQVGFTANGGAISLLSLTGTNFSTSGIYHANQLYWRGTTGITDITFALDDASTNFRFAVNNVVAASINATSTEGLVLGIASSLTGRIKLFNSAGATYTQLSAGNAASSLNYILPATAPTAGQVLTAAAPSGSDVTLSWGAGGGSGAPADATYLTLSLNGTLTNERVFTLADTTLTESDGGAGGNYTIGVNQANTFNWTAAHTHTVAIGSGSATSTSPSPFLTVSPTTAPGSGNYKASPSLILNGQANSGAGAFNTRYRLYALVNDNAGAATFDVQFNNANVDSTFRSILQLTQGGATGIGITGAAAGSGVTLAAISSDANENLTLSAKGTGNVLSGNLVKFSNGLWAHNGNDNGVVIGKGASQLQANTSSVCIGFAAHGNATGDSNGTFVGRHAGYEAVCDNGVAIGHAAGQYAYSANSSVLIGYLAGRNSTLNPAAYNFNSVIIGVNANQNGVQAASVVILGSNAGNSATNCTGAVMIGDAAGANATNADNCVLLGRYAGGNTASQVNNVMIGYQAGYSLNRSNSLVIDGNSTYSAAGNTGLIYGEFDNRRLRFNGNVGIFTSTFGTAMAGGFAMLNGTAPSSYPADTVQLVAGDYAAGDARWKFYSENGASPVIIGGNAVLSGRQVVAKTANYTVLIGESNTVFTNTGAAGAVIFTLPGTGVVESYTYQFFRVANQSYTIQCPPGVIVRVGASATSAGGTVTLDAVGSGIWLIQVDSSVWYGYTVGACTFA